MSSRSELGKLDFLADYYFAMRSERACNLLVAWITSTKPGFPDYMSLFPFREKTCAKWPDVGDN